MPLVLPLATDPAHAALLRDEIERSMARVPAMMHAIDAEGRLTFVSDAWLERLGHERDDVLGRPSTDFLTPQSRDYARSVVLPEFFRTGRCNDVHYQVVCRDGSVIDVLLNGVLQTDAEGRRSSIAVLTDVTAMKQAERRVAESETRYRLLAENSTDIVTLLRSDGARLYVSPACEAITGFTAEEIMAKPPGSTIHPDDVARVLAVLADPTGRSPVTYRMARKDGGWVWVETSMKPVTIDGRSDLLVGIVRNVEDRVRAEENLLASEARYRFLADNSADVIILVDASGKRTFVSPACEAMLGFTPEEMLAMNTRDTVHPDDADRVFSTLAAGMKAGTELMLSYRIRRKDDSYIWVEATGRIVDTPGANGLHLVMVRDIQQRVEAEQQLKDSEARYRLLAEHSTDMIVLFGRDGTRHYVSPACTALTGFSPEEMLATRTGEITHPEDRHRVAAAIGSADGKAEICFRLRCKDDTYIWVEASLRPVSMDGRGDLLVSVVRNVDERMRAEQMLQESEIRYRFLAENATDLIMLVDHRGRRQFVSPACRSLLGYEPEEMVAMNSRDTIHPDDAERVLGILARGTGDGSSNEAALRYRMRRKDGSYVWVETSGRAVDAPGQRSLRLLVVRNVEQRIQAEQQVRDSEARYRLLADNSSDMVFQLDHELVRRYVSPACRELVGYEPEEMVGVKPVSMVHPDEAPCLKMTFELLLGGAVEQQSVINRIRHRDGRWIWVEARLRGLKDPATGAITGIIGALRDISSRKRIEDELADANRRLRTLASQDGLTGLANRRTFDEALAREHLRGRRERTPLALIMIDVDHFKRFNDVYGHPAGDECLRQVANVIAGSIGRPADLAARYGGEEFAVLLPNTDEDGAELIAERIASAIFGLGIVHEANASGVVTVSAGVSALDCTYDDSDVLVHAADRALYRAKDFGRNAVIRASEVGTEAPHAAVA